MKKYNFKMQQFRYKIFHTNTNRSIARPCSKRLNIPLMRFFQWIIIIFLIYGPFPRVSSFNVWIDGNRDYMNSIGRSDRKHNRIEFGRSNLQKYEVLDSGLGRMNSFRSTASGRKHSALYSASSIGEFIYSVQSATASMANSNMGSVSPVNLSILYTAGLFTSFSPCALGLLPLTVSYISAATGSREDKASLLPTLAYTLGLATVFVLFGLSVTFAGGLFGQSSDTLGPDADNVIRTLLIACLSSGVSIMMGLQLLGIISLPLPSIEIDTVGVNDDNRETKDELQSLIATFLLGGSSALVASPCATPVLTSILAFVATNKDPIIGATLLFVYTIGYSTPLILVGATGGQALAKLEEANTNIGKLVTPVTASVLIWLGTISFLKEIFGDPSYAALI